MEREGGMWYLCFKTKMNYFHSFQYFALNLKHFPFYGSNISEIRKIKASQTFIGSLTLILIYCTKVLRWTYLKWMEQDWQIMLLLQYVYLQAWPSPQFPVLTFILTMQRPASSSRTLNRGRTRRDRRRTNCPPTWQCWGPRSWSAWRRATDLSSPGRESLGPGPSVSYNWIIFV